MQKLNELYTEIRNQPERWLYYSNMYDALLFPVIQDYFNDKEEAYNFILKYFYIGGKSLVFKDLRNDITGKSGETPNIARSIEYHACHTVSAFFLGIKIAEIFNVRNGEEILDTYGIKLNFLYYWFLTCLYHDIGYLYERIPVGNETNGHRTIDTVARRGFNALREICRIEYLEGIDRNRIFVTYDYEIAEFYLKSRAGIGREEERVIEHGLAGGILLYDRLRKQFEIAFKNREEKERYPTREIFYVLQDGDRNKKLWFKAEDYDAYARAADAIISHNIWLDTLREYIRSPEIRNDYGNSAINAINEADFIEPRIKRDGNELAFILALADTIEPVKRGIPLDHIEIDESNENEVLILKIDTNFEENSSVKQSCMDLIKYILDLENWVKVRVRPDGGAKGPTGIEKITIMLRN